MSILVYNGIPSTVVNARIVQPPEYRAPERAYSSLNIAGRNGNVIIDTGFYQNVERKYTMSMDSSKDNLTFEGVSSAILSWLNPLNSGHNGYYKLTDAYDPSHFRWAKTKGDISITNVYGKAGTFELVFDCMPQRFLVSGEENLEFGGTTVHSIINQTSQIARPKILVKAGSTVTIENDEYSYGHKIINASSDTDITVDSTEEDCYYTLSGDISEIYYNGNGDITFKHAEENGGIIDYFTSYEFPVLYPGENKIKSSANGFEIVPNWWVL